MIVKVTHNIKDFNRGINLMDQMIDGTQPSIYTKEYLNRVNYYRSNIVKYAYVSINNPTQVFMTMSTDECEVFNFCSGAAFILEVIDEFEITHDYTDDLITKEKEYLAQKDAERKAKREAKTQEAEDAEQQWNPKIDTEILLGKRKSKDIASEINCSSHAIAPRRRELKLREEAEDFRDKAIEYINNRIERADKEARDLAPFELKLIQKYSDKWDIKKEELTVPPAYYFPIIDEE